MRTITILAACLLLAGCALLGPSELDIDQADQLEQRIDYVESLAQNARNVLDELSADMDSVADTLDGLDPESRAEAERLIAHLAEQQERVKGQVDEFEGWLRDEAPALRGQINTLLSPDTTGAEAVATTAQIGAQFLPPPFNGLAGLAAGGVLAWLEQRRRRNKELRGVVSSISAGASEGGAVDWKMVAMMQDATGVRDRVRKFTEEEARKRRDAEAVLKAG